MCSIELWHRQIEALGSEARIIAFDMRGHGGSGFAPTLDYSIEAFADDLDAVLEAHLADGERAVIAGHSMGAMTVAAWAHALSGARRQALRRRRDDRHRAGRPRPSEALVVRGRPGRTASGSTRAPPCSRPRSPSTERPKPVVRTAARYVAFGPEARDEDVALVGGHGRETARAAFVG